MTVTPVTVSPNDYVTVPPPPPVTTVCDSVPLTLISIIFLLFQMVLAKALYDNIAETPEEIAFSRGDILTVLERDTRGLEGWWLCMLRDKTGIAPGNRLRVLAGMYSPHDLTPTLQRRSHVVEDGGGVYQSPSGQGNIYNTPPSQGNGGGVDQTPPNQGDINWNRRSWLIESDKVNI